MDSFIDANKGKVCIVNISKCIMTRHDIFSLHQYSWQSAGSLTILSITLFPIIAHYHHLPIRYPPTDGGQHQATRITC